MVDEVDDAEVAALRAVAAPSCASADDDFTYEVVVVSSFEDAVIAVMFNHNVQSCVLRYQFAVESKNSPVEELRLLPAAWCPLNRC